MRFEVGDRVAWTSQSAGAWALKVGEVTEVIEAGTHPGRGDAFSQPGGARDHESYVVRASAEGRPKRRYWPRVSLLRPFKGAD